MIRGKDGIRRVAEARLIIMANIHWNDTPQGADYWRRVYDNITMLLVGSQISQCQEDQEERQIWEFQADNI